MLEILKAEIIDKSSNHVTSKWMLERIPFIFKEDLASYIEWKNKLSELIGVDGKSIALTGSAAVGLSLNPDKNFKAFDGESDIDVAIVSDHYFDISWHYLRNLGPRRHRLTSKEKLALQDHRERLIYWGTIATDRIIQILPFGQKWVKAVDEMSKIEPTVNKDINFRIYKDFESLREYQSNCISKLKDNLIKNYNG